MIECSNTDLKKANDDDDDQIYDDDDDEDEDEEQTTPDSKVSSQGEIIKDSPKSDDDDELWFDTTPHEFELQPLVTQTFGLLGHEVRTVDETDDRRRVTFARRSGSIIKDEGFDSVSLKDDIKPL